MYQPATKSRAQLFTQKYAKGSIVPPRPLAVLHPLFEAGTLLFVDQEFDCLQRVETTIAEYCEIQSKCHKYSGPGAYKQRNGVRSVCVVKGCAFHCKIRGRVRKNLSFICEQLVLHDCTTLTTEAKFPGRRRCNYSSALFAAVPELADMRMADGFGKLAAYTHTLSDTARVMRICQLQGEIADTASIIVTEAAEEDMAEVLTNSTALSTDSSAGESRFADAPPEEQSFLVAKRSDVTTAERSMYSLPRDILSVEDMHGNSQSLLEGPPMLCDEESFASMITTGRMTNAESISMTSTGQSGRSENERARGWEAQLITKRRSLRSVRMLQQRKRSRYQHIV